MRRLKPPHERLRSWRIRSELTQRQAADLFGTRREVIVRWEMGRSVPRLRFRDRIEMETGIPIDAWETGTRPATGAKLTPEGVVAIRKRLAAGERQNAIAAVYGVSPTTISRIHMGRAWGWLEEAS